MNRRIKVPPSGCPTAIGTRRLRDATREGSDAVGLPTLALGSGRQSPRSEGPNRLRCPSREVWEPAAVPPVIHRRRHAERTVRTAALTAVVGLLLDVTSVFGASYAELKSAAVKQCQAIDLAEYQSRLFFNPEGYRSYYVRSACFQEIAVQFRDEALCAEVRRRLSLLSSSWGYSRAQCRELVAQGAATDQRTLEEMKRTYMTGAVTLRDFRVERNGNGRDFDVIPSFGGEYAHGYRLTFEIVPAEPGAAPILLHSSGYHVDGNSNLRVFVRQDELRRRFPDFALDHPYTVRATLILDIGNGGPAGYWSDAFIERVFPIRERSQAVTREVRF
jgi:hypothetical protein